MRIRGRAEQDSTDSHHAFEQLFRSEYPALLRFANARVGADAARDIVAEVFTVAWRKFDHLPDPARPWLYGVARGVIANQARGDRRRDQLQQRLTAALLVPRDSDPVAPDTAVLRALATLPERDQLILRLIEWDDLDPESAAAVVDCSVRTFNVRLHRARRKLAAALYALNPNALNPDRQATKELRS